jgi:hypothetical protein
LYYDYRQYIYSLYGITAYVPIDIGNCTPYNVSGYMLEFFIVMRKVVAENDDAY